MRKLIAALAFIPLPALAVADFGLARKVGAGETVIDVRPIGECRKASLPGARCLPPTEFLGQRGQLPSERDLLWLLGTTGLDGSERVVVTGDSASTREFVAGLLYLAGQHEVRILDSDLTPLVKLTSAAAPGQERGLVRSKVFIAPMRDHLWAVVPRELGATPAIVAPDAYTAIRRFTRQMLDTGQPMRVGWALAKEKQ